MDYDSTHQAESTSRRADSWAVAFALTFPTLLTYVYFTMLAAAPKHVQYVAFGTLKAIQFAFPLFWYVKIQRRKVGVHKPSLRGVIAGIAFGLTVLAAMWVLYSYLLAPYGWMDAAAEPIRAKIGSFGVATLPAFVTLAVFYSLVHSLLEEYYWRWFVFGQLRRLVSVPAAIAISSIGFMAHHVLILGTFFGWSSALTWLFSLAVAIGGAIWAWFYNRFDSLYPVWLSHVLVDAGIFAIGYHLIGGLS